MSSIEITAAASLSSSNASLATPRVCATPLSIVPVFLCSLVPVFSCYVVPKSIDPWSVLQSYANLLVLEFTGP